MCEASRQVQVREQQRKSGRYANVHKGTSEHNVALMGAIKRAMWVF